MCHEQTLVPIPDWATRSLETFDATHPEFGIDEQGRRCFTIDSCIVPALLSVWAAGFKTLGCCCGHESGHGVISIDLGWENQAGVLNPWLLEHHCVMCGVLHGEKEGKPLPEWASNAPQYAPSEQNNYATRLTIAEEQVERLTEVSVRLLEEEGTHVCDDPTCSVYLAKQALPELGKNSK